MDAPATIQRPPNLKLGIIYAIISAFSSALMSVFAKILGKDLPVSMLVFFRFAISFVLLIPFLFNDPSFTLKIYQPVRYIIRILAALLALFLLFYALDFIPLVDALLLNSTSPLFVPLLALLLLGSKTPKKSYMGIALGFIGVIVVLHPGREVLSFGSIIALASGVLAALAIVQLKAIAKTSSNKQMFFYYFLISTVVAGLFAAWQWKAPADWHIWLLLLAIGVFGTGYQVFATLSWVNAPVRITSPLAFSVVIFGGIFDWLIWNHTPSLPTIIGFVLVVAGALISLYFGQELLHGKK